MSIDTRTTRVDELNAAIERIGFGSAWQTHAREELEDERDALLFDMASAEEREEMLLAQAEERGERNFASSYGLGL